VCAEALPSCEPPFCGCGGKGWEIITSDPTSSSTAVLGQLRRCESCEIFPDDECACDAATAAGLLVDPQHNVLSEPWGRYADSVRRQARIDDVVGLLACSGRLLGTCSPSIRFYALGNHVFSVKTTTILDYSCELAHFEEAIAQSGVPGFQPASGEC
jgi:hypothetical protein